MKSLSRIHISSPRSVVSINPRTQAINLPFAFTFPSYYASLQSTLTPPFPLSRASPALGTQTGYQDVLLANPVTGTLELHRVTIEPVASMEEPGGSAHAPPPASPPRPSTSLPVVSGLTQMMRSVQKTRVSGLRAQHGLVATWDVYPEDELDAPAHFYSQASPPETVHE